MKTRQLHSVLTLNGPISLTSGMKRSRPDAAYAPDDNIQGDFCDARVLRRDANSSGSLLLTLLAFTYDTLLQQSRPTRDFANQHQININLT
jgi:hypothetical protein